jgi:phage portal protein BeeE
MLWPSGPRETVNFNGLTYPLYNLPQTLPGGKQLEIETSYGGLSQAYLENPIVYACVQARMSLFSEATFLYRQIRNGRPGDLFSKPALDLLTRPWPGGTTGDLLGRMSQQEDLAGNAFVVRLDESTLFQPRPDWVTIVLGADNRTSRAVPIGIIYHPGGRNSGLEAEPFQWSQVAHYMPTPDPLAPFRGVGWLRVLAREVSADFAATEHKLRFFENGATPNMIVSLDPAITGTAWKEWIEKFDDKYGGVSNAYKTMYLGAGAQAQVVGKDLQQLEFKATQGAGETRIAAAAGVPPVVAGFSEGLSGSSLNAGNFAASMRRFADLTMRPRWRNAAGSLAKLVPAENGAQLWYNDQDIPALKDDISDAAAVQAQHASAIRQYVDAGFVPASVIEAIKSGDLSRLEHTNLYSVQLRPPMPEGVPSDQIPNGALAKGGPSSVPINPADVTTDKNAAPKRGASDDPFDDRATDEDDHYYGAWSGGKKSEGGHPKGNTATTTDVPYVSLGTRQAIKILGSSLTVENGDDPKVVRHLRDLGDVPPGVLRTFVDGGGKIAISAAPSSKLGLKGKPRGWSAESTWKDVPGVFDPDANLVFAGDTSAHGSTSLMLHELGHAMDHYGGISSSIEWSTAWEMAKSRPGVSPYFRQPGNAGAQEMWAEVFAIHVKWGNSAVAKTYGTAISSQVDDWMKIFAIRNDK